MCRRVPTVSVCLCARAGQVCVSQFSVDGKFYRAEIEVLLSHGMLDVYYVDYGNRERVALQAVRKIEDKFMVIPKQVRARDGQLSRVRRMG